MKSLCSYSNWWSHFLPQLQFLIYAPLLSSTEKEKGFIEQTAKLILEIEYILFHCQKELILSCCRALHMHPLLSYFSI
jgi:hypothetical protein